MLLLFPVWWMNHKQLYYSYVAVLVLWYLCVKEQPEFIIPWSRVSVYSAESPAGGSMITLMAVALPLSAVCRLIPGQGFEKASLSPVVILASVNAWKPSFCAICDCQSFPNVLQIQSPLLFVEPNRFFLSLIVVLDSVLCGVVYCLIIVSDAIACKCCSCGVDVCFFSSHWVWGSSVLFIYTYTHTKNHTHMICSIFGAKVFPWTITRPRFFAAGF